MKPDSDKQIVSRSVLVWLCSLYGMVLAMVILGGITRLTGSGLSMVEWRPLFGILPPLNEAQWLETFEKYKLFPQFQQVNSWMQLADFKRIFFWEYFHRLFGRGIGFVFAVPFAVFIARGTLRGRNLKCTGIAFVLGGLQGLLGWFMVKSGLVDMPAVSHLRLCAHLVLAFVVAQYILWLILDLRSQNTTKPNFAAVPMRIWVFLALVWVQIAYGAFTAGTRGGYMFATFPTFGGLWFPEAIWLQKGAIYNLFYNTYTIQFVHRYLGLGILAYAATLWWQQRRSTEAQKQGYTRLLTIVLTQVALGILTLLSGMHITIAVAHQALALILLSVVTTLIYQMSYHAGPTKKGSRKAAF